jgi:hypothetical protein
MTHVDHYNAEPLTLNCTEELVFSSIFAVLLIVYIFTFCLKLGRITLPQMFPSAAVFK